MSTWVIGDIQGCYTTLNRLLRRIGFHSQDRVWLVGDLVNRGPDSLAVLRWARGLGDRAVTVLGNHDLHLLALGMEIGAPRFGDTLEPVLEADDAAQLLAWLRERPLFHREGRFAMVHAGLLPQWSLDEAAALAAEAGHALRGPKAGDLLAARFLPESPRTWADGLPRPERDALVLAAMTRVRTLTPEGGIARGFNGPPHEAPEGTLPWFEAPGRRSRGEGTILFGHWSALGLYRGEDVVGLDTGCVWGRELTAYRLEDGAVFSEPSELRTLPDSPGASGTPPR